MHSRDISNLQPGFLKGGFKLVGDHCSRGQGVQPPGADDNSIFDILIGVVLKAAMDRINWGTHLVESCF